MAGTFPSDARADAQLTVERMERFNTAAKRVDRLAEMVSELTGCPPGGALHAVREHGDSNDALAVVARAMVDVDQPPPTEFRAPGDLRDDESVSLVHHSSLRRWERPQVSDDDTIFLD